MKKIDLGKTSEKIKVSLAIDEDIFRLIEDSLAGFKTISLLSRKGYELKALKEEKAETTFSAILNRSEFITQIIYAMQDDKAFVLSNTAYSMNELTQLLDKIAFASFYDYYMDLTKYYGLKDLSEFSFLNKETIEEIRPLSVKETVSVLDRSIRSLAQGKSTSYLKKYIDLYMEGDDDYYVDNTRINEFEFLYSVTLSPEDTNDYVPHEFLLEPQSFEVLIPEIRDRAQRILDQLEQDAKNEYEKRREYDIELTFDDVKKTLIDSKFNEITDTIAAKHISNELIVKILRNRLFGEKNTHFVHIFESYVRIILNL